MPSTAGQFLEDPRPEVTALHTSFVAQLNQLQLEPVSNVVRQLIELFQQTDSLSKRCKHELLHQWSCEKFDTSIQLCEKDIQNKYGTYESLNSLCSDFTNHPAIHSRLFFEFLKVGQDQASCVCDGDADGKITEKRQQNKKRKRWQSIFYHTGVLVRHVWVFLRSSPSQHSQRSSISNTNFSSDPSLNLSVGFFRDLSCSWVELRFPNPNQEFSTIAHLFSHLRKLFLVRNITVQNMQSESENSRSYGEGLIFFFEHMQNVRSLKLYPGVENYLRSCRFATNEFSTQFYRALERMPRLRCLELPQIIDQSYSRSNGVEITTSYFDCLKVPTLTSFKGLLRGTEQSTGKEEHQSSDKSTIVQTDNEARRDKDETNSKQETSGLKKLILADSGRTANPPANVDRLCRGLVSLSIMSIAAGTTANWFDALEQVDFYQSLRHLTIGNAQFPYGCNFHNHVQLLSLTLTCCGGHVETFASGFSSLTNLVSVNCGDVQNNNNPLLPSSLPNLKKLSITTSNYYQAGEPSFESFVASVLGSRSISVRWYAKDPQRPAELKLADVDAELSLRMPQADTNACLRLNGVTLDRWAPGLANTFQTISLDHVNFSDQSTSLSVLASGDEQALIHHLQLRSMTTVHPIFQCWSLQANNLFWTIRSLSLVGITDNIFIPSTFFQLPKLRVLILQRVKLFFKSESIGDACESEDGLMWPQLKTATIRKCPLRGNSFDIQDHPRLLSNCTRLNVDESSFVTRHHIAHCTQLRSLTLHGPEQSQGPKPLNLGSSVLKSLSLFAVPYPLFDQYFPQVESLTIHGCPLRRAPDLNCEIPENQNSRISKFPNCQRKNCRREPPSDMFLRFPNLEKLSINGCPNVLFLPSFGHLTRLTTLSIVRMGSLRLPDCFDSLCNLKRVEICGNHMFDTPPSLIRLRHHAHHRFYPVVEKCFYHEFPPEPNLVEPNNTSSSKSACGQRPIHEDSLWSGYESLCCSHSMSGEYAQKDTTEPISKIGMDWSAWTNEGRVVLGSQSQ